MPVSINRVAALLLLAFVVLAGALGFWVVNRAGLTARDDNPRPILAEQRILRGAILDRHGERIVETIGERGDYTRHTIYPYAAPFAGYYSIVHGTSGVERDFDDILRGTAGLDPPRVALDSLLHIGPSGRAVQLTIDLDIQRIVDAALDPYIGAIVVLSIPDSDVLALASRPTFDPNMLDETWDALRADQSAPLLNRATQSRYQPGTALLPLILSEALQREIVSLDSSAELLTEPVPINSRALECINSTDVVILADAFRRACPKPFADVGATLGSVNLQQLISTWQLTGTNPIGIEALAPFTRTIALTDTQLLREFAIGQGALTVTPLQMASAIATLANGGVSVAPRIVSATQTINQMWEPSAAPSPQRILPPNPAGAVVNAMNHTGDSTWHAGEALSGPTQLHWFLGFTPIDQPRYAIAILIETPDTSVATSIEQDAIKIGQMLLSALPD